MSEMEYQIEMWESTPYVELFYQLTVPVSCPGCSVSLQLEKHIGLTVSSCSVTFSATDPPFTNHSLRMRAVPTAGTNSRILKLQFASVTGTLWTGYKAPDVIVSYSVVATERSIKSDIFCILYQLCSLSPTAILSQCAFINFRLIIRNR